MKLTKKEQIILSDVIGGKPLIFRVFSFLLAMFMFYCLFFFVDLDKITHKLKDGTYVLTFGVVIAFLLAIIAGRFLADTFKGKTPTEKLLLVLFKKIEEIESNIEQNPQQDGSCGTANPPCDLEIKEEK